MKNNVADIKITIPIANERIIDRKDIEMPIHKRLIRLTIVRAPIGYGKTMLVSKSFSEIRDHTSWLTLDELDNDPVRFWTYVIKAIARSGKPIHTEQLLSFVKTNPPLTMIIDMLVNELGNKSARTSIILDDYQTINNPVIHKMMNRFIDYLPQHVKVFIISRNEVPLAVSMWKTKGWVYEIGVQQLQFQLHEVREFFEKSFIRSHHSLFFYQQALRMTEGWPLGLQLINLTQLQDEQQWEGKDSSLLSPIVANHLLHEIFSGLSPSLQEFLIRTSLLKELTPSSCDQVMNRRDSENILKDLEKRGLFINRLDNSHLTYRYHDLFSRALQSEMCQRFSKEHSREIYIKTAYTLYENGDYPAAVELAIKGELYEVADQWIVENLVNIFVSRQTDMLMRWVLNMRKNTFEIHVETLVLYAFILAMQNKTEKSASIIRELDRRDETTGWRDEEQLEDAVVILDILKMFLLYTQCITAGKRILQLQKRIHDKPMSANSRWKQVSVIFNHFEPQLLRTNLGNRGKPCSIKQLLTYNDILRSDEFLTHDLKGYSHGLQAEILYETNVLTEAVMHIEKAMEYTSPYRDAGLSVPLYIVKAKIYLTKKEFIKAQALLTYATENIKDSNWKHILITMKALGYIREGSLEKAEAELITSSNLALRHSESSSEFWMLVQARLYMEKGNTRKALNYIESVIKEALEESQMTTLIEAKVLRSICLWQSAKKKPAINELHEALELAVKSGYKRLFLDEKALQPVLINYIKTRMNFDQPAWKTVPLAFAQSLRTDYMVHPVTSHQKVKPKLTPREEQLIKALATGLSNKEIAEELFLSEGTVRVYLSKVYKKLNVRSRTQAILQAEDWQ